MIRKPIRLALGGAVAAVALLISFIAGAYIGSVQFWQMNSSTRAYLLVRDLQEIHAGSYEKRVKTKEMELDIEIMQALSFLESGHPWLFWPFSEGYDHDTYLRTVALYRKAHPPITATLDCCEDEELKKGMDAYRAEVARRTTQLIERYGN
ncbi:hypothetical protein [Zoogloea dura]|uniref:Uncharacterized protein n=1 Tax=Zoogloea dura TaxID=2728840 RepID=A0A848G2A1_9RHOO|nr:hypothetical protein [Zoogloea dura]NML26348.1 hypothetical protein [Zoogloea dura]